MLINKALYSIDGFKIKLKDEGVSNSLSSEGDIEVETFTIDSLGKFNLVKMDIEGQKGN